ncbi:MAG: DinB family protein [Planctomycetota bacterium]
MIGPGIAYGYLERTRTTLFDAVRPLDDRDWHREFEIGPRSLSRTFTHLLVAEWYYVRRMKCERVPAYEDWPIDENDPPSFARFESLRAAQSAETTEFVESVEDWDQTLRYEVDDDHGRLNRVRTTLGGMFTQLVLNEVHHRAQALNMLRRLDVALPDLDFNAVMFDRTIVARGDAS